MGSEWLRMSANWLLNSFRQPTVCSLALRLDNGAELAGCQLHLLLHDDGRQSWQAGQAPLLTGIAASALSSTAPA